MVAEAVRKMGMKDRYVVEIKKDGKWKYYSDHGSYDHAKVNKVVQSTGRGREKARIMCNGEEVE